MRSDEEKGPQLDLDWELKVFRGVRAVVRRLRGRAASLEWDEARAALLAPREAMLQILAQTVSGDLVRIRPSGEAGGVLGRTLLLPAFIDELPTPAENHELYVLRTAIGAAMVRLGLNGDFAGDREARVRTEIDRAKRAAEWLASEWPAFGERYAQAAARLLALRPTKLPKSEARIEGMRAEALTEAVQSGGLLPGPSMNKAGRHSPAVSLWGEALRLANLSDELAAVSASEAQRPDAISTELAAPKVAGFEQVKLNPQQLEDAVLQHTFEKIETADKYRGGARDLDGADELDDHLEALGEVSLSHVIRSDEATKSMLKADIGSGAGIPDVSKMAPGENGVPYDEWDDATRRYKRDWCTVYPTPVRVEEPAWGLAALARNRALIERMRREIVAHRSRLSLQRRQLDGERVDIDALVAHLASVKAGNAGPPRLYARKAKTHHDVATLVLLDLSLSSDSWIQNRRVLDVSREAVLVLGEVAESLGDRLGVLAFASHTRNHCRVFDVRGFGEPWQRGRARLGALRPQGYTRIGPALRHAVHSLSLEHCASRLVLLVTDGKPTDYDRYEGRHGIQDVRQAVREAKREGIHVHGLTVDESARDVFPAMLGRGHWNVLRRVEDLPVALSQAYGQLSGARKAA